MDYPEAIIVLGNMVKLLQSRATILNEVLKRRINFAAPQEEIINPKIALQHNAVWGVQYHTPEERTESAYPKVYIGGEPFNNYNPASYSATETKGDVSVFIGKLNQPTKSEDYYDLLEQRKEKEKRQKIMGKNNQDVFDSGVYVHILMGQLYSLLILEPDNLSDSERTNFNNVSKTWYFMIHSLTSDLEKHQKLLHDRDAFAHAIKNKENCLKRLRELYVTSKQMLQQQESQFHSRNTEEEEDISKDNFYLENQRNSGSLSQFRAPIADVNAYSTFQRRELLYKELLRHESEIAKEKHNIKTQVENLLALNQSVKQIEHTISQNFRTLQNIVNSVVINFTFHELHCYTRIKQIENVQQWEAFIMLLSKEAEDSTMKELQHLHRKKTKNEQNIAANQMCTEPQQNLLAEAMNSIGIFTDSYKEDDSQNFVIGIEKDIASKVDFFNKTKEFNEHLKREYFEKTLENIDLVNTRKSTIDLLDSYILQTQMSQKSAIQDGNARKLIHKARQENNWLNNLYFNNEKIAEKRIQVDEDINVLVKQLLRNDEILNSYKANIAQQLALRKRIIEKGRYTVSHIFYEKRKIIRKFFVNDEVYLDKLKLLRLVLQKADKKHIEIVRRKSYNRKAEDDFMDGEILNVLPGPYIGASSLDSPTTLTKTSEKPYVPHGYRPLSVAMKPLS